MISHKAVFLDRDGVINRPVIQKGRPKAPQSLEDFVIIPDVPAACQRLKKAGYLLIVITNQPDVGRGTLSRKTVEDIHALILKNLPIDAIEVCYDSGENPSDFRKPAPGMVLKAASEWNIDLKSSFLIGDRWRDIECGLKAGCRTVFIDWGYREQLTAEPDVRVKNISQAAEWILTNHHLKGVFL